MYVNSEVKSLSCVWLFVTPWTVACRAPPSFGFSRQEYWSGLPFPSPGDLPGPGIEPGSPTLQADSLTSEPPMLLSQFVPPSPTQLGLSHLILFLIFCSRYLYMWKIRQRGDECKETWHQQTFAKHLPVRNCPLLLPGTLKPVRKPRLLAVSADFSPQAGHFATLFHCAGWVWNSKQILQLGSSILVALHSERLVRS